MVYEMELSAASAVAAPTPPTIKKPLSEDRANPIVLDVRSTSPKIRNRLLDSPKVSSKSYSLQLFSLSLYHSCSRIFEQFWQYIDLVCWFLLNVVITLYCKLLFSQDKFPYPMIMTAVHMAFTFLGVWSCHQFGMHVPKPLAPEMRLTILWFSVVFTINIWLSNASLLAVSVSLHQVIRTIIPLFTMGISALIFKKSYPISLLPSVLLVIAGVALTVWGDFDHYPLLGLVVVLLGCFFSALKGIITQRTQVGSFGLSSLDLLRYLCPLAFIQLLLVATWIGEASHLWNHTQLTTSLACHLTSLGCIAFGINVFSFRCAAAFNPLTLNIAGNVKQVSTCLLSLVLFGGVASTTLVLGIFGTAAGATWYFVEMSRWQTRQKAAFEHEKLEDDERDLEQQSQETDLDSSGTVSSHSSESELKDYHHTYQRSNLVVQNGKQNSIEEKR